MLSAKQQAKTDDTKRLKSQISNLMVNLSLDHVVIHFSFNHRIKVHAPTTFQPDLNTLPCLREKSLKCCSNGHLELTLQKLYSSNSMTSRDFFCALFIFTVTLGLAVTSKNFQNFPSFRIFFYLNNSTKTTPVSTKMHSVRTIFTPLYLKAEHYPCFVICSN